MLTEALRKWNPAWVPNADELRRLQKRLLDLLEQTSRGITDVTFPTDPSTKRILISGFDPFGFPNQGDIRQSNLSGATAIALDGETLTQGTASARVESVVFPVRYADFNDGIVENHLRPHLTSASPPHLVMSISQGSSKFELEEFAGRRRSVDTYADNLGQMGGGSPTSPVVPPGVGSGAEFIKETVPTTMLDAMRGAAGRKGAITEETEVSDLPSGATKPRDLPKGPGSTPDSTKNPGIAVTGSGGGYLSNEIFYRNSLLQVSSGTKIPMIHLHTPMLAPGAADTTRNQLIDTVRNILRAAVPTL
jgi:pyrrolidone-carboxylate peptidase